MSGSSSSRVGHALLHPSGRTAAATCRSACPTGRTYFLVSVVSAEESAADSSAPSAMPALNSFWA